MDQVQIDSDKMPFEKLGTATDKQSSCMMSSGASSNLLTGGEGKEESGISIANSHDEVNKINLLIDNLGQKRNRSSESPSGSPGAAGDGSNNGNKNGPASGINDLSSSGCNATTTVSRVTPFFESEENTRDPPKSPSSSPTAPSESCHSLLEGHVGSVHKETVYKDKCLEECVDTSSPIVEDKNISSSSDSAHVHETLSYKSVQVENKADSSSVSSVSSIAIATSYAAVEAVAIDIKDTKSDVIQSTSTDSEIDEGKLTTQNGK